VEGNNGAVAPPVQIDVERRPQLAGPVLAAATLLVAVILTQAAGVGFRDPDGVLGRRLPLVLAIVAALVAIDTAPHALRAAQGRLAQLPGCMAAALRARWSRRRLGIAALAIGSFYVTYLSYRNLKSVVPLLSDGSWDARLLELDRDLLFGHQPAALLHDLLGTGVAAHLLSTVYVLYLGFVPLTLGVAVALNTRLRLGLWYALALGFNWVLGAASYFLLPSLGPIYAEPTLFGSLPETATSALQHTLFDARTVFLADPEGSGSIQSIAAFASLHVSIVFTAALMAQLLHLKRSIRICLWSFLGLTLVATIYFGWHYIVDDVAGLVIGGLAVFLSRLAVGPRRGPGAAALVSRRRPAAKRAATGERKISSANLPNAITVARIVLVVPFVLFLGAGAAAPAAAVFAICLGSDVLDGYLARSRGAVTALGQLLDPLADKLLVGAALGMLVAEGMVPWWVALVVVGRELAITALRTTAARCGNVIPASSLGKVKMTAQSAAILALLALPGSGFAYLLLYAAVALTVVSGVDYALRYRGASAGPRVTGAEVGA